MDSDTDFSSDDEPLTQSQTAKRTKTKNKCSYKIHNALKPPRTTSYTAKALYGTCMEHLYKRVLSYSVTDQIYQGQIDLNPEYQRGMILVGWWMHLLTCVTRCRMESCENEQPCWLNISQLLYTTHYFRYECFMLSVVRVCAYCAICPAVKTRPDGTDEKVCIDGKQRLSSMQAYVPIFTITSRSTE